MCYNCCSSPIVYQILSDLVQSWQFLLSKEEKVSRREEPVLIGVLRQRIEQHFWCCVGYSNSVAAVVDVEVGKLEWENDSPGWVL